MPNSTGRNCRTYRMVRAKELGAQDVYNPSEEIVAQIDSEIQKMIEEMRTADGVKIVEGLRVFTNNLDRGSVDLTNLDFEYHHGEKRWVPWFDVLVNFNYKDQKVPVHAVMQSNDRVAAKFGGLNA